MNLLYILPVHEPEFKGYNNVKKIEDTLDLLSRYMGNVMQSKLMIHKIS